MALFLDVWTSEYLLRTGLEYSNGSFFGCTDIRIFAENRPRIFEHNSGSGFGALLAVACRHKKLETLPECNRLWS